ncbi:MAG: tetratricopeptide repeat protein [Actinobacteria bacterium]|nr:tetratricopeptide repeat protein [Actinomycetota bacterium]
MPSMNRKNLIAIAVAAIVVVALVIIVPGLASNKGDDTAASTQTASNGQTAPPISPGATVPPGHPAIDASGSTTATTDMTALVKAAEDAYKAKPKNLQTLLNLGDVYIQANKPDDATKIFNEALVVDANSSLAKVGLAMAKFVKGDATGAQADLEKLIAADPKDQTAQYDLAIVYFQAGQTDKAKVAWVAAAAIDPASDLGKMSQQFVDMMKNSSSSGSSNPHGSSAATTTTT